MDKTELEAKCASASFDDLSINFAERSVVFRHSVRDADGKILAEFRTEVHVSELQPRPLLHAELRALYCLGLCHCTYVLLLVAKKCQVLQMRACHLSPAEVAFFRDAFSGALAEYFYLADLDLAALKVECCCPPTTDQHLNDPAAATLSVSGAGTSTTPRVLVPFGGGKDSTLLMELVSRMGAEVAWVYYGEWKGSWEDYKKFHRLAEASPAEKVVLVEQHLPDLERMRELNLMPDITFTDYVAYVSFYTFASAFVALQLGYQYICVGNEHSANEANTRHARYGYEVNHQYEKSFRAERAFNAFMREHISPSLHYFSGLQHMTELEIAQRFAAACADKYLHLIISCNWATDDDWCGACEKCCFVYLLFAAFLPPAELMARVFAKKAPAAPTPGDGAAHTEGAANGSASALGSSPACNAARVTDMFDSESHQATFESLMGVSGHKPFECVGTPEECLAALFLAHEKHFKSAPTPPLLFRKHLDLITSKGADEWAKIQATIRRVNDSGNPGVPNLYPAWYRLR